MYRDIVEKASPAVVMITCPDMSSKGSGFLISPDGYIVTNNHVISKLELKQGNITVTYSNNIVVNINGISKTARLIVDPQKYPPIVYDYAILKVDGETNLHFLELGDPSYVKKGDKILCLGFPLDFNDLIVTDGIVSAIVQRPSHINSIHLLNSIVTNAIIQFGNSGGPMLHTDSGKVIGINSLRHELRDALYNRLVAWCQHPSALEFNLIRDLVQYSLKYTYVGFNHAVSIEHVSQDPAMPK